MIHDKGGTACLVIEPDHRQRWAFKYDPIHLLEITVRAF
jgi:hypothetical protein